MTTDTPIYADVLTNHPDVLDALARLRWTYAAALKAADAAIAARKRPAKKTARKGKS